MSFSIKKAVLGIILVVVLLLAGYLVWKNYMKNGDVGNQTSGVTTNESKTVNNNTPSRANPLDGKKFYVDKTKKVVITASAYENNGDIENAKLLGKIASKPSAIWLVGPNESDLSAERDIREVVRTSEEAKSQGSVPIYKLYAIPQRDACAEFSNGGFTDGEQYLAWVDRILENLKTPAVFVVEADAVGHTIRTDCLSEQQTEERYNLLKTTMAKLSESPKVVASYLDAGHSEWFPDPKVLTEALKKSGVTEGDGVAVNVSNFIATPEISEWSKKLAELLGSKAGVVIDTSRNGKGSVDPSVVGDARWCNPAGRGLGMFPTTDVDDPHIDAYLWIKIPGESDGACFGYPPAGTFVADIALELARNSQ